MHPASVEGEIRELEQIRKQARAWRLGATLGAILFVVACVLMMNNAVQGLVKPGPTQEEFVSAVSQNLNQTVIPQVKDIAVRTFQESQPVVQTEFGKLNNRVPEVAEAGMKEFEKLQTDLPTRAEKVLDESFGEMLKSKEAKIKQMFPDVTDDKVQALVANLTDEGTTRLSNINEKMFSPHIQTMTAIANNMGKIEMQEAPSMKGEVPTWQMGLLFFDIARADMKGLEMPGLDAPAKPGGFKTTAAPLKPAQKPAAKPAQPRGY